MYIHIYTYRTLYIHRFCTAYIQFVQKKYKKTKKSIDPIYNSITIDFTFWQHAFFREQARSPKKSFFRPEMMTHKDGDSKDDLKMIREWLKKMMIERMSTRSTSPEDHCS